MSGVQAPDSYQLLTASGEDDSDHAMATGFANHKEEAVPYAESESSRIPLLWGSLIDTGLADLQPLGTSGSKRWLHVDHLGVPTLVEVDKHRVVSDLGIRYRDLLILDPTVPTPSPCTLLIRDRAMVANLEATRMIICANQVYVLSVPKAADPRVAAFPTLDNPFVKQLCKCLREHKSTATMHDLNRGSAAFDYDAPFELRALEVGLATATNILDREVFELEKEAYPAIDRLAKNVSRQILEDVRQVKQVMGRLITRVQRLKQEIDEVMEDDADMADMYLGRRAMMMGEDLPPDPLGLAMGTTQSSQAVADLMRRSPHLAHIYASESDVAHMAAPGSRPPSRPGLPQHTSASSLPSLPSQATAPQQDGSPRRPAGSRDGLAGHPSATDLQQPAREHLGHHSQHPRGGGSAQRGGHGGGRRHPEGSGHGSQQQQHWQRASTVVRTVRTVKKKKGKGRGAGAAAPADAAAAVGQVATAGAGDGTLETAELLEKADSAPPALSVAPLDDSGSESSDEGEVIETIIEQPAGPAVDPHDIQDAEDLLESYFVQVDYLLRRLLTVSERIDDVEDLVSIEMDHRRNELVATDLMVTIVSCGFAFCAVVVGLFGVNLHPFPSSKAFFWGVVVITAAIGLALVLGLVWWVRKRRLLFVPQL